MPKRHSRAFGAPPSPEQRRELAAHINQTATEIVEELGRPCCADPSHSRVPAHAGDWAALERALMRLVTAAIMSVEQQTQVTTETLSYLLEEVRMTPAQRDRLFRFEAERAVLISELTILLGLAHAHFELATRPERGDAREHLRNVLGRFLAASEIVARPEH